MKYINTPFCFTGGKFKLLDQIIPEFDYSKNTFVDLFTGGGSVYTNVLDKYEKIIVNDIIKDLIGIHKGLLESDEIIEKTKSLCPGKDDYDAYSKLRDEYNDNNTPEGLWSLMLSCNSNLMRFNKSFKFNQTFGKRTFNSSTQLKTDEYTNHIRQFKNKIEFQSKHFYDIELTEPSFVYLDPPYSRIQDTNGNMLNTNISEAGYNCYFASEDDIKLYEYVTKLHKDGHTFMISGLLEHDGKESWILNKLITDGFIWNELDFNYDKVSKKGKKQSREIIIRNY